MALFKRNWETGKHRMIALHQRSGAAQRQLPRAIPACQESSLYIEVLATRIMALDATSRPNVIIGKP